MVKIMYCSYREPEHSSQHPSEFLQPLVIPTPEDLMPPSGHNGQLQSHLHAHTPCMHIIKNKNKSKIFYNDKSWVQMPVNSALKEIEAGGLNVQGKSRLIQQALVSKEK